MSSPLHSQIQNIAWSKISEGFENMLWNLSTTAEMQT